MSLADYGAKRNFSATPEPKGRKGGVKGATYVIQKHDATRLHYDLRLEMDGVLKSWAVTRGPSLVAGEKRLAVEVEDHPLEYRDFEGTIPKSQYGGGDVILWDRGTWTPVGDPAKALAKGHLDFELEGEKLRGRWHLVRMHRKPRDKHDNWLLIKGDDEFAREAGEPDILTQRPESVKSGRLIGARGVPGVATRSRRAPAAKQEPATSDPSATPGAEKRAMPAFVEPMLATLVSQPPEGERWLHEIKFDGYRLQARVESGRVKLMTRTGLDWTKKFGAQLLAALQGLAVNSALIDGELVVERGDGASDFSLLQADLSEGRSDRFVFYVFDLLYLDGYDLSASSLLARKAQLKTIAPHESGAIRYSGHFEETGARVLSNACRLGLEGVVSKSRESPYKGGRGKMWLKSKCSERQEFVIAGYVLSTVSRRAIGSLVLGAYEDGTLKPVGRVGTGFTVASAEHLFRKLEPMRAKSSPFAERLTSDQARGVRFVRPQLVAEVEFRAWTADGHLRHASFRGLREDKPANEIARERPAALAAARNSSVGTIKSSRAVAARKSPVATVRLTHPDRLYWPEEGVTKEGLADYYAEAWPAMSPFVVDRPLALLRCPDGIHGQKFFQKHAWKGLNPNIVLVNDPKDSSAEPLLSIRDFDGLMGLVQSAALEIHPWASTLADWERPDTIVMDLDPGEDVSWAQVIAGANEVRRRLTDSGLTAFVKTSGGKGLHVCAPLKPRAPWPAVKAFAKAMADAMSSDSPNQFVSTIAKAKRGGKILVDYLRNQRGATAVAPYSTRARPGAGVSMPVAWEELDTLAGPAHFTILNAPARLASPNAGSWREFRAAATPLQESRRRGKSS